MNFEEGAKREGLVKEFIEHSSSLKVSYHGQGAGNSKMIPREKTRTGIERFTPDLKIEGTNVFLEVTGSKDKVDEFWIRREKIMYAIRHPEMETLVVFVNNNQLHVVCINQEFKQAFLSNKMLIVKKVINNQHFSFVACLKYPGSRMKNESFLVNFLRKIEAQPLYTHREYY